jgi:GNAT superfamily N-acetyltransferase
MITVRDAVVADAPAVQAVRLAGWRAAYGPLLPADAFDRIDLAEWTARSRQRIERASEVTLVAEDGSGVVGMCVGGAGRDEARVAPEEIYAFYVLPQRWSQGVGRALMGVLLGRLGRPLSLWVLQDNPRARRFYERCGFRADGTVKPADLLGTQLPEVRYILD